MKESRKPNTGSLDQSRDVRPTIGYLAFGIDDHIGSPIWAGVVNAARQRDVNLVCFVGERLRDPNGFLAQANIVYDLVHPSRVDGLVIWTSTISTYLDQQECVAFVEKYHPLPIVSLGTPLKGIPLVEIESYRGVREMMTHLIAVHGYRRLAFIRGPENHPYSRERYRAYTDALAQYGLPLDPNLVTPPGNWAQSTGDEMVRLLLDQRGLKPRIDFEVVVTASDLFALGALEALRALGVRVPEEVGVVGFNDIAEGRAVTPPLTSVAVPFFRQGEQALEIVLAMLAGERVPEQVILPARLVVRQSCGCVDAAVVEARVERGKDHGVHLAAKAAGRDAPVACREVFISETVQALQATIENLTPEQADQLVRAFAVEIEGEAANSFLSTLEGIFAWVVQSGGDMFAWQSVISVLRRCVLSYTSDGATLYQAENLAQQARVLIGEMIQRAQLHREVQTRQYTQTLRRIGQTLIATFDVAKLRDVLADEFPALGIPSCYLSLYEDPGVPTGEASLILAYDHVGQIQVQPEDRRFPSYQLAPRSVWARKQRYTIIVTALYFEENQLGLALFEMGPLDGATYGTLRGQISSALRGALLLQERQRAEAALVQAYAKVEEQVEERTRELQREIAERRRAEEELQRYREHLEELVEERTRELAKAQAELVRQERLSALGQLTATVAHEIRNPLGTVRTSVFSISDAIERDEMDRVARALQLAERNIVRCDAIITELLDYTRDRVLQKSPTDIDAWLDRVLDEALDQQVIPENIVCVRELNADVEVLIDDEHLRRAIVNVINNAVDAMQGAGAKEGKKRLTVSTQVVAGRAGSRLEIGVSDTGCGIPDEVKGKLFEPLFSTKSFGVGLGLLIVKGIIEQHGGGIEVSSQVGVGTTVVLWLPVPDHSGD